MSEITETQQLAERVRYTMSVYRSNNSHLCGAARLITDLWKRVEELEHYERGWNKLHAAVERKRGR